MAGDDPLAGPQASQPAYPCFRQPELVSASADRRTLVAFTEAYPVATPGPTGSCAPPLRGADDIADVVYRRSTDAGPGSGLITRRDPERSP